MTIIKDGVHTIEGEQFQASGFAGLAVRIHPDPSSYNDGLSLDTNTNDVRDESILDDIFRKYGGAWETLAKS